jgi:hypothetical protein
MNYLNLYHTIINRRKATPCRDQYTEKHHIIPRSLGGSDDADNLVNLTAREHFIAHRLLCEIYPQNVKLKHALWLMNEGITLNNYSPSSRTYQRLKEERSRLMSGSNSLIGKKIIQYDLNGDFIKIWNSIKYAGKVIGVSDGDIVTVCRGRQKSAGGYQWRYYEEGFTKNLPPHTPYKKPKGFGKNSPLKGKKRPKEHTMGRWKPINQYDKNQNFLKSYKSIREACPQFKGNIEKVESNIGGCLGEKQKTAYGFIWKYQKNLDV